MTTYHYAGTCKLGDDRSSVVDRRLAVRGVGRLRIADASVMPVAPVAALNAPSMMIGHRAAGFALAAER
jgi:choline dehydrogenase-like flavoprotein